MSRKEYTVQNNPKNPMIKAAVKKGLTGVKITKYMAMSRTGRGIVLECDQIKWTRIGSCQETAIKTITELKLINDTERNAGTNKG